MLGDSWLVCLPWGVNVLVDIVLVEARAHGFELPADVFNVDRGDGVHGVETANVVHGVDGVDTAHVDGGGVAKVVIPPAQVGVANQLLVGVLSEGGC